MEIPVSGMEAGALTIQWAVFLPLGDSDGELQKIECPELDAWVSLFLDGYFFIDAGRNRVKHSASSGEIANESELRAAWNDRLARVATLPLVIPALESFVEQVRWPPDRVEALTQAIKDSDVFELYQHDICRDCQWVFAYQSGAAELGPWLKLPASKPILEAPRPDSPDQLAKVFPVLADALQGQTLTFKGYPRLANRPPQSWSTELVNRLLDSVPIETVFADGSALEYLASFVNFVASPIDEMRPALVSLLRRAFSNATLEVLERHAVEIRKLVKIALPMPHAWMNWAQSRTPSAGRDPILPRHASRQRGGIRGGGVWPSGRHPRVRDILTTLQGGQDG
jgi:hypothetical protein